MTGRAHGGGVVLHMTLDAGAHGRHAGCLGHRFYLGDLAVAHFAFHPGIQMFLVRPRYSGEDSIDSNPRHGLARFRVGGKFFDRGFFGGNRMMAGHAGSDRRERHEIARCWIGMAGGALQANRKVYLVTVGKWLRGRRVIGRVVGHCLFYRRRVGGLPGAGAPYGERHGQKKCRSRG
jgi:hypothetical protein